MLKKALNKEKTQWYHEKLQLIENLTPKNRAKIKCPEKNWKRRKKWNNTENYKKF